MTYLQIGLSGLVIGLVLTIVFNNIIGSLIKGKTEEEKNLVYKSFPKWVLWLCIFVISLTIVSAIVIVLSLIWGI